MSRQEFLQLVLEQMSGLEALRSRGMFGGYGLYQGGSFFALIAQDRLYFKADEQTRQDFVSRGLGPFTYVSPAKKIVSMQYYEAPPEVYEDGAAMREWANKAIDCARRAAAACRSRGNKPRKQ